MNGPEGSLPRPFGDELRRISQGDHRGVDALLEKHLPELESYVRRRIGGLVARKESSHDVLQSTCREVLVHGGKLEFDGEEGFRRWLFAMALRRIRNKYHFYRAGPRDAAREEPQGTRPSAADARLAAAAFTSSTPSRAAVRHEQWELLCSLMERMPGRYREVLELADLEQRSGKEIAERLGLNESHVRVLLSRARAHLARLAADRGGSAC